MDPRYAPPVSRPHGPEPADKEYRQIMEDDYMETLDQAKKRRAELLEDDPDAEGLLVILGSVDD